MPVLLYRYRYRGAESNTKILSNSRLAIVAPTVLWCDINVFHIKLVATAVVIVDGRQTTSIIGHVIFIRQPYQ